jgi:hypothetical protein
MKSFLSDMAEQKKLTGRILLECCDVKNVTIAIPVIISEVNLDIYDNKSLGITVSNVELNHAAKSAIKNTVFTNAENLHWFTAKEIDREVKSEFSKFVTGSSASQRVKDMANKLFLANNYQTVQNAAL